MVAVFYGHASPIRHAMTDTRLPKFGLGTWRMGEDARLRADEVQALRAGLDLGVTLIDTAEMYGEGGAEQVVGDAIAGRRDAVTLVSKIYPHNAGARSAIAACERSLARLRVEAIDVYLLHWRGRIPLAETVGAFERLRREGKIRAWGVSNFDVGDMHELLALPEGKHCVTNQVLYHLGERTIEWSLLPLCRERGIDVMAYSPLGQGDLLDHAKLRSVARRVGATPAQVALAFLLGQPGVVAIPKAVRPAHLRDDLDARELVLDAAARAALDAAFPPPKRARALPML
jgi:diketogulonate reductase-like aldo/keto reductase